MSHVYIGKTKIGDHTFELFEPTDQDVEVSIDGVQGMLVRGPVVKFNFVRELPNLDKATLEPGDTVKRVVVSRVVMGVDTFLSIADWITERAKEVRSQVTIEQVPRTDSGSEQ